MQNLELLTAVDVAKLLKISESSIWNWQYGRKTPPPAFRRPSKLGIGSVALIGHSGVYPGSADHDHGANPAAGTGPACSGCGRSTQAGAWPGSASQDSAWQAWVDASQKDV
jgi:predicted DNA-binding transcriptional regulator AlpA